MNDSTQTYTRGLNTSLVSKYIPYFISFFSLISALFLNEANIRSLKKAAPERLETKYEWIKTADDASYLRPTENYYHHTEWKDNNAGRQSYFLRTPGYGMFRYLLMSIMGLERSYYAFKYVQLLLFSISVLLLYYIALFIGLGQRYALLAEAIYGLSPLASGFLYYSITEGITPALMIGYVFFLFYAYRSQRGWAFLVAGLMMGYIGLTRPVLLLFGAALPPGIWWSSGTFSFRRKTALIILTGIIALSPISLWALRNAMIAGKYVGVYPIYYPESNSQYRPTHAAIWEFMKSYGTEGVDFHKVMVPLWEATRRGDTADRYIDNIMAGCPGFVKQTIGDSSLRHSLIRYRRSITYQCTTYPHHIAMPDTIPAIEENVIKDFSGYADHVNSSHWIWCHIFVPLKLFKSISFHSNLSLYVFQYTLRGMWWMEIVRVISLLLHFACCLSFLFVILMARDKLTVALLGIGIGGYFLYLCYIFRGLEERYTLPILPLMLLGLIYVCQLALGKIKKPSR
jgi:hypothetical protein